MTLIGKIRKKRLEKAIQQRQGAYEKACSSEDALNLQLALFNALWKDIRRDIPFYANLADEYDLPDQFQNWDHFIDLMPVVNREMVQKFGTLMCHKNPKPDFFSVTGGTTSQPIQLPVWRTEQTSTRSDLWLGRSWYGIQPDDKLFTIWGHSHLLGRGLSGWKNRIVREVKDKLLGYYRYSAYDLSERSMRQAADCLLRFGPRYVLGYSKALDMFARVNQDVADDLRKLRLKAVVGTAESFPTPESVTLIGEVFGCSVAMEYGSVETLGIAHTHPEGYYRTFWQNYFLDVVDGQRGKVLQVTSLYKRCFPLIRYQLGDEIERFDSDDHLFGIRTFQKVVGRCNDWVTLSDGFKVHSEAFTHTMRACKQVMRFQVVLAGEDLSIQYLSKAQLTVSEEEGILFRLEKVHPDLRHIDLQRVEKLQQSLSGKTPMIYRI